MTEPNVSWIKYGERNLEVTSKTPPSFDEWKSLMFTLNAMNESGGFWRGDLYLAGEQWFGENQASSVFDPTNWNVKTWQNNASVCRRIPVSLRRERLTYTHHAEVAYLEPDNYPENSRFARMSSSQIQSYYLQLAIDTPLSSRQLHDQITKDNPLSTKVLVMKRLQKIEELLLGLIDDVEGDVQKNVRLMHRMCMDAIDMQRGEEN